MSEKFKRPMEGWYLRDALKKLAEICSIADNLQHNLEPLSKEDISAGATPLTLEQITPELEMIALIATSLALDEMQATTKEWYAASDAIE